MDVAARPGIVKQHVKAALDKEKEFCREFRANDYIDDRVRDTVFECLNKMYTDYECDICQMPGHRASYCWLNNQMFDCCQRNPTSKAHLNHYRELVRLVKDNTAKEQKAALKLEENTELLKAKVATKRRRL